MHGATIRNYLMCIIHHFFPYDVRRYLVGTSDGIVIYSEGKAIPGQALRFPGI
jgi:hypothetical protein